MGEHAISQFLDSTQKREFTKRLLNEIRALDYMLENGMIESKINRIGAEQELVLLDDRLKPALNNMKLLEQIGDEHYTTEIARFNLEINLDPFELANFEFDQSITGFKYAITMSNFFTFNEDGKKVSAGKSPLKLKTKDNYSVIVATLIVKDL